MTILQIEVKINLIEKLGIDSKNLLVRQKKQLYYNKDANI